MVVRNLITEISLDERVRRVNELDLGPIKFKLVHEDGRAGLNASLVDLVEIEYKRFLVLNLKSHASGLKRSIVPTKPVDTFWHAHILDTEKYGIDCEFCLGFFLHHFPYLGLRGPADAQTLRDLFRESQDYYLAEFGAPLITGNSAADCDGSDCAPEPSCSGEPDPRVMTRQRPVYA